MPKSSVNFSPMQVLAIFTLFLVAIHAVPHGFTIDKELNGEWESYKVTFRRKYDSLNEIARRIIWEENLKYIQKHNVEYDLGKHTYYLGLNEYADLTNEEFRAKFLRTRLRTNAKQGSTFMAPENVKVLPPSVDWRKKGYVTPVKNQVLTRITNIELLIYLLNRIHADLAMHFPLLDP